MNDKLNLEKILLYEKGLAHYYSYELGIDPQKTVDGKWGSWKNRQDFWNKVHEHPEFEDTKTAKELSKKLEDLKVEILKGVSVPESPDSTTPKDLDDLIKEQGRREEEIKKIKEKQRAAEEVSQTRQRELYEESEKLKREIESLKKDNSDEKLKGKVLYATVSIDEDDKPVLNTKQKDAINTYRELSKERPITAVEQLQEVLVQNVSKQLKVQGLSENEIKQITRQTAIMAVESLNQLESKSYIPPTHQVSILAAASNNKSSINKLGLDQKLTESLHESINNTAVFRVFPIDAAKKTFEIAFGKEMSSFVFGVDPEKINVIISNSIPTDKTSDDVKVIDLNTVYKSNIKILENQSAIFDEIAGIGREKARDYLFNNYFSRIISQKIESLPTQSVVKKVLTTPEMRIVMYRNFGVGTPTSWGSGEIIGNLALRINPQYAPILTSITGGSYAAVAASSYAASYTAIQVTGGIFAAEAFAGGAGGAIATGAAAGSAIAPVIGTAIGAVVGYIGGEVITKSISRIKVWWTKNKESVAPVLGVTAGLSLANFGLAPAILGGTGTYLFFGGTASALLYGPFNFFRILGRNIGIAIATPVIVTLLIIPPLVAFIMLVINNSAYVVPPSPLGSSGGADNPYMLVTKEANPTKIDRISNEQNVIYLVTVKALKTNLTNVKIQSSECNVIKKDESKIDCPKEIFPDVDNISISPTNPYAFTFVGRYDSKYNDSLIYDSITFSAEVEGKTITTSGSASVCIGECPQVCAEISNNGDTWPTSLKANSEAGLGIISKYQGFTAKLCKNNEKINLCYKPSQISDGYYAWHIHNKNSDNCDVYFNNKGLGSETDAAFIITHELTHHVQSINGIETVRYLTSGGWFPEVSGKGFCTYSATKESATEAMSEAAALYVNSRPSWDLCASNYRDLYPKNFNWAQSFMEK